MDMRERDIIREMEGGRKGGSHVHRRRLDTKAWFGRVCHAMKE